MRPSRILSGALACALLLGACNDSADPEPPPLPGDAQNEPDGDEEDNTESDEIDVSTVPADPDDIDEEYVQAVMDEIDPIIQAAATVIAATEDVADPNVRELYTAAYEREAAERQLSQYTLGDGPSELRDEPQSLETTVHEVLLAKSDCVLFTADRDFLAFYEDPEAFEVVQPYYVRLETREPDDTNPTAWHLTLDTFFSDEDDIPPLETACD